MLSTLKKMSLTTIAISALSLSPLTLSHFDDKEMQQSYRQSWFALVASSFGPIVASVKGEIPWNQAAIEGWGKDLAALATLNTQRGFTEGSDKGTTRAKPEIWQNKEDFESKMSDMKNALADLQKATAGGDKAAIGKQVGATGEACKACHDEYKAKNYLY